MSKVWTWDDHEASLAELLEPLDSDRGPAALAVCFGENGDATWMLDARHGRGDEEVDPLTELAVAIGELAPPAAVIALPARVRHVDDPDDTIARMWQLTSCRRDDAGATHLRARVLPVGGLGQPSDLDVELSPVASVLDDALRHPVGEEPIHVLSTLLSWRHELLVFGVSDEELPADRARRVTSPSGRAAADTRQLEAVRHRLRRHAKDLARRHRPAGPSTEMYERPAVHASTPAGWQAACPI